MFSETKFKELITHALKVYRWGHCIDCFRDDDDEIWIYTTIYESGNTNFLMYDTVGNIIQNEKVDYAYLY